MEVTNNSEKLIYKLHFQEFIYAKSFYEVIFLNYKKKREFIKLKNTYNQETFRLIIILFESMQKFIKRIEFKYIYIYNVYVRKEKLYK